MITCNHDVSYLSISSSWLLNLFFTCSANFQFPLPQFRTRNLSLQVTPRPCVYSLVPYCMSSWCIVICCCCCCFDVISFAVVCCCCNFASCLFKYILIARLHWFRHTAWVGLILFAMLILLITPLIGLINQGDDWISLSIVWTGYRVLECVSRPVSL